MTLNELIQRLTDLRDDEDCGEVQLRAAYQPNYPLAGSIQEVTIDRTGTDDEKPPTIWIAIGAVPWPESGYAPSHAWNGEVVYPDPEGDEYT